MSGIIEGYNYDIFISYRQKDNKHDGWVTEFVENLKGELESTFKEEISVYFDINPHDGLLETHDVVDSLKDKLKCLVFIPIISRTYCDSKSFAWEHEFKAFVEQASKDQFGLKVKLPNGNVASRVLPIRIHELDIVDIKECESVLGGVLRGIEFIYKESGIDKPLTADDDEKKNLNKTKYRIQIIKLTHAIKEIIQGIKAEPVHALKENTMHRELMEEVKKEMGTEVKEESVKLSKIRLLSVAFITAILIITAIFAYPKIFKQDTLEKLRSSGERISVAVMPFQNMTNDTIWNVWQDGIQDMLITSFSDYSEELSVRQVESIRSLIKDKGVTNYASLTPSVASNISQKLNANIFIYGNLKQAGSKLRIYAQMIDPNTEEVFKSFLIEDSANEEKIFQVIDSLSEMVKDFLIISKLIKEQNPDVIKYEATTKHPEAFKNYIKGNYLFFIENDYPAAINMYLRALAIDSNYISPAIKISYSYWNQGIYTEGKKWCQKLYEKRDQMPVYYKAKANIVYAMYHETPYESIKFLKQLLEIDDQLPDVYTDIGYDYNSLEQYSKAIPVLEKAINIYKQWGVKPIWAVCYTNLITAYYRTGEYKKMKKLLKKAEKDFPDDPLSIAFHAIFFLVQKDTISGNRYIDNFKQVCKEQSLPDVLITSYLAMLYSEAGVYDKAEKYYRQAPLLEPENHMRINDLSYFLIDNDRNINEGIAMVDSALKLNPVNYNLMHTKGWGLYKQGKYQEALELLQKSWDLRREKAIYNHKAYLHLEAAKKAVAGQMN